MASTIKGITIEIGGDTTKLDKALSGVNKNTRSLQSELKSVNSLLKLDPKNTELLAQKQTLLKQAIAETKDKLDVLKQAEAQVQAQFEKGEVSEEQYRALQREIVATEQSLKGLEEQAKAGKISLEGIGTALGTAGQKTTELGNKLMPVTAGITALGAASVAACMEMDDGYDTVITKTGATGEALEDLTAAVDTVFANLPTDAENAGIAVGEVNTRFGLTGEACAALSEEFIKFAEINGTDLNSAIDGVDAIMTKFGVDSAEAANVLGLLTKAGQDTGLSMETLYTTLQTNGATLKEMGLDLTSSVNLLAQFEANGVDASTALAGLKKAQQNATAEGKTMEEALGETIDAIKNASSETEALQIATDLFGKKGAAEMTQAIREGRLSIDDLSGSLEDYGTTVSDTFEATLDPWDDAKVAMNNLKLAGSELGSTLLSSLQPTITKIVNSIKNFTTWFKNLNQSQQETIIKVAAVVAAIGPALVIIGKVITAVSSVIGVITKIGPAITAAKAGFAAFNAVLAANPIILVVTAIVALIAIFVTLYNKCEWFRDGVNAIWEGIKNAFLTAFGAIKTFFTETLPNAFNTVVNFVKSNWQGLLLLLVNPFAGAFKLLYDNCEGFRNTIDNLVTKIKEFFQGLWDKIVEIFSGVGQWFSDRFTEAYTNITNVFKNIGQWFANRWQDIKNTLSTVATWYTTMWTNAWNGIVNIFKGIGQWFGARWTDIKNALSAVPAWFQTQFQNAWTNIKNVFSNVTTFFSELWTKIKGCFVNVGTAIGSAVGDAFKSAINSCLSTIEGIINKFIGMINGVIDIINEIPGVDLGKIRTVSLPRLAKGGVLREGSAIMAEAGPELISMVNGRAIVTPLTNSARNTALDAAGAAGGRGGFVQNNYYTSPKALSPSECARQTRNATRNMILQLQGGT